jgi:hypothetical protein
MGFDLTINKAGKSNNRPANPLDAKRAAIEAAKAASARPDANAGVMMKYIKPAECSDRNRIVFDDSGSMSGYIEDAKKGVVEYLRNLVPNQSAVGIHFMNTKPGIDLQSDLIRLSGQVLELPLSSGGTPFFNTLKEALEATPTATRLIAFTDGSPTDRLNAEGTSELQGFYSFNEQSQWTASADVIVKIARAIGEASTSKKCIPIDTVFFGGAYNTREIALLKYLSDQTGGFFLHFDPAKPNIWKQLKYLAPVNRLMLASASFRAAVEIGRK